MFQVSEISFCDKKALNIKSDDFKKYILDQLNSLYNVNIMNRHYEVLNTKNVGHLQNNPYVISVKSLEGNNYYLFCLRHNDVNTCIFIDRKVCKGYAYPRMICVKYQFDDTVFTNTLFEGEMVKYNDKHWAFIINDIISHNNSHLTNVNLMKRLSTLNDILTRHYKPDLILDICKLQVKKYFSYTDFDTVLHEFIPSLTYQSKGFIFKSIHLKFPNYLYVLENVPKLCSSSGNGTSNSNTVKNSLNNNQNTDTILHDENNRSRSKSPELKLIDTSILDIHIPQELKIVKGDKPDTYYLYKIRNNDASEEKIGLIGLPNLKTSKWVSNLFKEKRESMIMCEYNTNFKKWVPILS